MMYRAIGLVSNANKVRLEIAMAQFSVSGQTWSYELRHTATYAYSDFWMEQLAGAAQLSAAQYLQLHKDYGNLLAETVQQFIKEYELDFQVQLIGNYGHSVFQHLPYQLGDSAAIAAVTGVNVVSDFANINAALGGNANHIFTVAQQLLPVAETTDYSNALYAAFFAVLRWREENNLLATDTGAARNSINGTVWMGQEW
jgi:anhydro-N-acetylmuramic acid kinase